MARLSRLRAPAARAPVLLLSLAVACASDEADPVILRLDEGVVRRSEFQGYLAGIESRSDGALAPEARSGLLAAFLEERALVLEARAHALVAEGATAEDEARAVARLLASEVETPAVSEAEVREYYAQHEGELGQPVRVSLRQILVGTLNEARDVKRRLLRNARAFDTIARRQSKGPEAEAGGFMGTFEPGQLPPELEAVAFRLAEGRDSDPIESPLGYHVLRVDSRQEAKAPSFEEARDQIHDLLQRQRRREAERAFVAGLMARSRVNHEAALRSPDS